MFGIIRDLHQRQMSRPFLSRLSASYSTYLKSHLIISRLTWSVDMHFLFTGRQQREWGREKDRHRDNTGFHFSLSHPVFKIRGSSKHLPGDDVLDFLWILAQKQFHDFLLIPYQYSLLFFWPLVFLSFSTMCHFIIQATLNTVVKMSFKSLLIFKYLFKTL